jgi:hypothetical protein
MRNASGPRTGARFCVSWSTGPNQKFYLVLGRLIHWSRTLFRNIPVPRSVIYIAVMPSFLSGPLMLIQGAKERVPDLHRRKTSRVEIDFRCLLDRMRQRMYPETVPVLASFWLKTIYWNGYTRAQWRHLDRLLRSTSLAGEPVEEHWRHAVHDIRNWIRGSVDRPKEPNTDWRASLGRRSALAPEALAAYTIRLLNEWLPVEVARLLVREPESGIPVLTIGRALERLLLRDRLSTATLEALLNPGLLSSRFAYPADLEMLRDVVVFLLGRTSAPAPPALPATLLATTADAHFGADFAGDVASAFLRRRGPVEELLVPITQTRAMHVLAEAPARIGSVVVTADGRCWEPMNLQRGDQNVVVYRSDHRLRLDYSADHLRLRIPWPDDRRTWSGIYFAAPMEIFGRRWKVASWEKDAAHVWLNLVFLQVMPASELASTPASSLRRSGPAAVDLAWAELETALGSGISLGEWTPIERLQREDLIPLGRALFGLVQTVTDRRQRTVEAIDSHLRRIRYLQSALDSSYGPLPWRMLPKSARRILVMARAHPPLLELLQQVFAGVPEPGAASRSMPGLKGLASMRSRSHASV